MKEEKKESPIGVLWGWGKPYHGKFIGSIALAVLIWLHGHLPFRIHLRRTWRSCSPEQ